MPNPYLDPTGIHSLPGRIRVPLSGLKHNPHFASSLEQYCYSLPHITTVAANSYTGKVLIYYDRDQISSTKIIAALKNFKQSDSVARPSNINQDTDYELSPLYTSTLLAGCVGKKLVYGTSQLSVSTPVCTASGIVTVATGYPFTRRLINRLLPGDSSAKKLIIAGLSLASLALRESIIGFTVVSLLGLTTLINRHNSRRHQHNASMTKAVSEVTDDYFPASVRQPLLPLTLLLTGIAMIRRQFSTMLAILVLGSPAAYSFVRRIPTGFGLGAAAKAQMIIPDANTLHRIRDCQVVIMAESLASSQLCQRLVKAGKTVITVTGQPGTDLVKSYVLRHQVLVIGNTETELECFKLAHVSILVGNDHDRAALVNVIILQPQATILEQLWQITHQIQFCQTTSFSFVLFTQTVCMILASYGLLPLANSLTLNHIVNLGVLLNSWLHNSVPSRPVQQKAKQYRQQRVQAKSYASFRHPNAVRDSNLDLHATDRLLGLSSQAAKERLQQFGLNKLPDPTKVSLLQRVASQCQGKMAIVILTSTGISLLAGGIIDTIALAGMFVVNVLLGAIQSHKAEDVLGKLQALKPRQTLVLRDGNWQSLPAEYLVPGDMISLHPGETLPADGWLISDQEVTVDESMLTGESIPVVKTPGTKKAEAELAGGTILVSGEGTLLVARTGMDTRIGQIALMLRSNHNQATPLQIDLDRLGSTLFKGLGLVSLGVFAIGLIQKRNLKQLAITTASMAVATVPQGLTTFVTLGLVAGVRELAQRKTIVRRLAALESMACVTCLCFDKTGTITENNMTVTNIHTDQDYVITGGGRTTSGKFLSGSVVIDPHLDRSLRQLLIAAVICNDARVKRNGDQLDIIGDGTEGALLVLAEKARINTNLLQRSYQCIDRLAFTSEQERMVVLANLTGQNLLAVKGSPEAVLSHCRMSDQRRNELLDHAAKLAQQGLRVLAFAGRNVDDYQQQSLADLTQELNFFGIVGMLDPPRPDAIQVIEQCRLAGIHVVMLTGDHLETALAIAKQVGLANGEECTMTGRQLQQLPKTELQAHLAKTTVFARVQPEQKREIVLALKSAGYVVAMVGDGVNDGPALKAADVGISLGSASTDVAQEAADVILANNDLKQIVTAIKLGRTSYDNISKVVSYLLTSNAGELSLMVGATATGLPMPLLPIQLLWVNLLGDGPPALALCLEPSTGQELRYPPRHQDGALLTKPFKRQIFTRGLRMGVSTLAMFALSNLTGCSQDSSRTRALAALGVEQISHLFTTRIVDPSIPVPENPQLKRTALVSSGLLLASVYWPPLQKLFNLVPLDFVEWLLVGGFSLIAAPPKWPNHGKSARLAQLSIT